MGHCWGNLKILRLVLKSPKKMKGPPIDENPRAGLLDENRAEFTVPKGHFAVYVGAEQRRFVVPTGYLYRSAFRELMETTAEEFGYGKPGPIRIPCDVADFEGILRELKNSEKSKG